MKTCMLSVLLLGSLAAMCSAKIVQPLPVPSGWRHASELTASPEDRVDVMVSLSATPEQLAKLEFIALDVSNPNSPMYGQYLSAEAANAVTAPTKESLEAVITWLRADGNEVEVHADGNTVSARMTVASAMSVFATSFTHLKERKVAGRVQRVAMSYEVPSHLEDVVENVFGLHGLPLPVAEKTIKSADVLPAVTPSVIETAYGIAGVKVSGGLKNRQAVAEFQGQTMNTTDLATFFKMYVPKAAAGDDKVYAIHGEPQQGEGIEALLDIQQIMGVAPGIKTEFYEQMNQAFCTDLKNWTTLLLSTKDVPNVHSISYGWQGDLKQLQCVDTIVKDIDADYQKLAARGISIIFASGDSGSGFAPVPPPQVRCANPPKGSSKDTTITGTVSRNLKFGGENKQQLEAIMAEECCQIGSQEMGTKAWSVKIVNSTTPPPKGQPKVYFAMCTLFSAVTGHKAEPGTTSGSPAKAPPSPPHPETPLYPSWPASSPWVTAVGATRFHNDVIGKGPGAEDAVSSEDHFGSGGGFSTMFSAGSWQTAAIAKYFKTVPASTLPDPTKTSYPKGGRGTPDVSALGTGYPVVANGKVMPGVGGTSASAPVFSAMVSLLNEARINAGKPALGFLNPWIYQNADAFTDVTVGSDKVGRGGFPLPEGFNCTTGWDPITGVGTPIFSKMLAAAMKK